MVISTLLFDKPPFKNVVVNGLVLAADGQKMSKSKKNYPDPMLIVDEFGADPLRFACAVQRLLGISHLQTVSDQLTGSAR